MIRTLSRTFGIRKLEGSQGALWVSCRTLFLPCLLLMTSLLLCYFLDNNELVLRPPTIMSKCESGLPLAIGLATEWLVSERQRL